MSLRHYLFAKDGAPLRIECLAKVFFSMLLYSSDFNANFAICPLLYSFYLDVLFCRLECLSVL